jgi:triosephosphate isomerase
MPSRVEVTPPFFEVGPKAYMYGPELLRLALRADALSEQYGVQIIITPQDVDISPVAQSVQRVLVFAQHMDLLRPGRGIGSALPEALKAAGAVGVLLNHSECPVPERELGEAITRAHDLDLTTLVCASEVTSATATARLGPDALIVEEPALIGTGTPGRKQGLRIPEIDGKIWRVDPGIRVLHAAGIGSPADVYDVIAAGAQGTGSSSAIFTAADPQRMLHDMIRATREAWDARHQKEETA